MAGRYDAETVKQSARGHWPRIATDLIGIPHDDLTTKNKPCPKCGGEDRFSVFNDFANTGGAICRHCFAEKNGDGIALACWFRGWKFEDSLKKIADYLGIEPEPFRPQNGKAANVPPAEKLGQQKPISDADRCYLKGLIEKKPPITFEAIQATAGVFQARWPKTGPEAVYRLVVPAYRRFNAEPSGYMLLNLGGFDFPAFGSLPARNKHNLGGSKDGWVIVGGWDRLRQSSTVWVVEGAPDAWAIFQYLPEDHIVLTNICGAGGKKKLTTGFFENKIVRVIGDSDGPGQDGAKFFCGVLNGKSKELKLLKLPYDITEDSGKDLRDFFSDGHTFDELSKIAEDTEPFQPAAQPSRNGRYSHPYQALGTGTGDESTEGRPEERDGRAWVEVTEREFEVNDKVVELLANDPGIYRRGTKLVRVLDGNNRKDGIKRPEDAPFIENLPLSTLQERLTKIIFFHFKTEAKKGIEIQPTHPPGWCVKSVDSRGHWPNIRPLKGIVEYPVIRPDGTVLDTPGYDSATELILSPNCEMPNIPESPTREDALRAVETLFDVVCDFPFAEEANKSSWLAFYLSLLAKFSFDGCVPLFLADANIRGSGKSMLFDLVCLILTGYQAPRMSNPKNDEEARKKITSIAIAGDRVILIDNIVGSFGGASLDAALTGTVWRDRKLQVNEMVTLPLNVVWCASGNNIILGSDMPRRVAHIRLKSDLEKPEERTGFKHPKIRQHVLENRVELLGAGLTILRAWFVAGKPDMKLTPWGSFDEWSEIVRNAIVWCGLADPRDACKGLASEGDNELAALRVVLEAMSKIESFKNGIKTKDLLQKIAVSRRTGPDGNESDEKIAEGIYLSDLREAVCELSPPKGDKDLPSVRSLGRKFLFYRDRVIDNFVLRSDMDRTKTNLWFVENLDKIGNRENENPPSSAGFEGFAGDKFNTLRETKIVPHNSTTPCKAPGGSLKSNPANPSNPAIHKRTPSPAEINHLSPGCQSERWWKLYDGTYHCLDCRPPKLESAVIDRCEEPDSNEIFPSWG